MSGNPPLPPKRCEVQLTNPVLIKGEGGRLQYKFSRITFQPGTGTRAEGADLHHNSAPLCHDLKTHLQQAAAVSGL